MIGFHFALSGSFEFEIELKFQDSFFTLNSILVSLITCSAPVGLNTCIFSTPVSLNSTLVSLISTLVSLFSTFFSTLS